ncbi:MAG: phenylalanine--tRNA ligase subunit alpha, partial [Nitrososphaerales archaeon]
MKPLHGLERKLLLSLKDGGGLLEDIASRANMNIDQARRAVEWLKSKGMINIDEKVHNKIEILEEGKKAVEKGLPERRLLEILKRLNGEAKLDELSKAFGSTSQEFSAALGHAKSKGLISTLSIEGKVIVRLKYDQELIEESLLRKINEKVLFFEELSEEEKKALNGLMKRPNYLTIKPFKIINISLTELGKKTAEAIKEVKEIDFLTSDLIISGKWREHKLRPLDLEAKTPTIYPGKKHPVQHFIDEVREAFVALGFEEILGPIIQPAFWNFDALFVPQDHPAREMQDTFYVSKLKEIKIANSNLIEKVSRTHINGWNTGSKGWGYNWVLDEAKKLVLRTHTTAVTV